MFVFGFKYGRLSLISSSYVSGGNSQIILAHKLGQYTIIGQTLDDAGGEALDKIAKNLGIQYPGGVNMEKIALTAQDKNKFHFKRLKYTFNGF